MTTKIIKAFEKEVNLTEEGLAELKEKKLGLVIDVTTKSGMTIARKERTERNKYIEQVKRAAIDVKSAIDARRGSITDEVMEIYAPTVDAFEAEDLRLKQEKEKAAKKEEERIEVIRKQITQIRLFTSGINSKSSQEISDIIEAVDMIDVEESFAEFTQEAMQTKKETLTELNLTLSSVMQKEKLAEEQTELAVKKKVFEDEQTEFAAWKKSQEKTVEEVAVLDVDTEIDETTAARMKIKSAMQPQFSSYIDNQLAGDFSFELAKLL